MLEQKKQKSCYRFDDGVTSKLYDYNSIHKIFNSPSIIEWKRVYKGFLSQNPIIKDAFNAFRNKQIFRHTLPKERVRLLRILLNDNYRPQNEETHWSNKPIYLNNLRLKISNIIRETKSSSECISVLGGSKKKLAKTKKPSESKSKKISKKKSPKIHTGPRGGKYIIKKGKKIYQ